MNSQQHKRITLKDISEQCGYSVNTVSRALRDDPRLPEATISRIKQVADELGYMKNVIASSMRSGHTNLIAVIVDDIQNPHYSDIISQISIKLRKYGYHTLILASYIEKITQIIHCPSHYLIMSVESFFFHEIIIKML